MGKRDDFWLDDPEWDLLRRRAEKRPVPKELKERVREQTRSSNGQQDRTSPEHHVVPREQKEVVLNFKLSVPRLSVPKKKILTIYSSNKKRFLIAGVLMLVVAGGVFFIRRPDTGGQVAGDHSNPSEAAQDAAQANFNPLVPLENLKDDSGKQSKPEFRYDKNKQVLGFSSEYNASQLTVSQQKLPEDFKSDETKFMSVAMSFGAEEPLQTQKGTAYLASDTKTKTQTAIFKTDEVLVFIRSSKELDTEEWTFYINQLNPRR